MSDFIVRDVNDFRMLSWLHKYMMGHKGFIAGGCFKNIFNNELVKDIDIFFENNIDLTKAISYFECEDGFVPYYDNHKVTAFKDVNSDVVIELIKSIYGTPEDVIDKFDFSIVKFAYYKDMNGINETTYKVIHHKKFFEHLLLKRLVTNETLIYPNSTFERCLRYAKYGYFPCRETKLHIINNIRNNANDNDTLSESLYNGVD